MRVLSDSVNGTGTFTATTTNTTRDSAANRNGEYGIQTETFDNTAVPVANTIEDTTAMQTARALPWAALPPTGSS